MKFLFHIELLIFFCEIFQCECESENYIIESLMKNIQIKHCIIVDDDSQIINTYDVKYFAVEKIYATFMNAHQFISYLKFGYYLNTKTAIIIKSNEIINNVNNYFSEVSNNLFL